MDSLCLSKALVASLLIHSTASFTFRFVYRLRSKFTEIKNWSPVWIGGVSLFEMCLYFGNDRVVKLIIDRWRSDQRELFFWGLSCCYLVVVSTEGGMLAFLLLLVLAGDGDVNVA